MQRQVLALLISVILVSGCTSILEDPEPEERLQQSFIDSQNSNYEVEYDVSVSGIGDFSDLVTDLTLTSHQDEYAVTTSVNFLGQPISAGAYNIDNHGVFCFESDEELECEAEEIDEDELDNITEEAMEEFKELIDEETVEMTYEGESEINNRQCDMYQLEISEEIEEDIEEEINGQENQTEEGNLSVDEQLQQSEENLMQDTEDLQEDLTGYEIETVLASMCIDTQDGFPAQIKVETEEETEIAGETVQELFTLEAESYNDDIAREDVEPPVSIAVNTKCEPLEAEIYSIDYEGDLHVLVNQDHSQTEEISPEETITLDLEDYEQEGDILGEENTVEVNADRTVQDTCMNTEGDTDFGFEQSDDLEFGTASTDIDDNVEIWLDNHRDETVDVDEETRIEVSVPGEDRVSVTEASNFDEFDEDAENQNCGVEELPSNDFDQCNTGLEIVDHDEEATFYLVDEQDDDVIDSTECSPFDEHAITC